MILSEYYSHYFNNGGICPICKHILTLHYGCTNIECKDCEEHMKKDKIFCTRMGGYSRKMKREKMRYHYLLMRINERKKLDKRQEKKYAEIKHSRLQKQLQQT